MGKRFYQQVCFPWSLLWRVGGKTRRQPAQPERSSSLEGGRRHPDDAVCLRGYCQHRKPWQVAKEHLVMWLSLRVLAFVKNRSAGNCGKNTQSHSPEVQRQTICSLRHLCLCIQQTFIENIPCARDWMKLCPCLQDLIVEWGKQMWI